MVRKRKILFLLLCLTFATPAIARDKPCRNPLDTSQPSLPALSLATTAMLPAGYLLRTSIHEGSHALVIASVGEQIRTVHFLPHIEDGKWDAADIHYSVDQMTRSKMLAIGLAPKITDVILLGTYSALLESDSLPDNKYVQLGMAIVGAGLVWDLGSEILSLQSTSDTVRIFQAYEVPKGEQIAWRLLQGGLTLAGAIEVGRGFYKVFSNDRSPSSTKKKTTSKYGSPTLNALGIGWQGQF